MYTLTLFLEGAGDEALGELLPETEYVLRVCATNVIVRCQWSVYWTGKTARASSWRTKAGTCSASRAPCGYVMASGTWRPRRQQLPGGEAIEENGGQVEAPTKEGVRMRHRRPR